MPVFNKFCIYKVTFNVLFELNVINSINSVIEHWNQEGLVVPPQAVKGVFTTGNTDNVSYDPICL